jgi:hypothetical protein
VIVKQTEEEDKNSSFLNSSSSKETLEEQLNRRKNLDTGQVSRNSKKIKKKEKDSHKPTMQSFPKGKPA